MASPSRCRIPLEKAATRISGNPRKHSWTWSRMRRELLRLVLVDLRGPAGQVLQTSKSLRDEHVRIGELVYHKGGSGRCRGEGHPG